MRKREKILNDIKVEKIGYGGVGIAKMPDGKKILIAGGALPNSIVDCKIVKTKKDYVQAHITAIKEYDPEYADGKVFCPHFFSMIGTKDLTKKLPKHKVGCGGCKRQNMSYDKQLELKQSIVKESFTKINDDFEFLDIVPSPSERAYRNKIEFSFGVYISALDDVRENSNLGFHKQGEFSKIIDIDSCGLISDKANSIFQYIKKLCLDSTLPVYDQKFHRGFFRHLVIREGTNTNQILVNLAVANDKLDEDQQKIYSALLKTFKSDEFIQKNVTTFLVTYNNGLADIVRGPEITTDTLFGDGYIYDKLNLKLAKNSSETTFRVSPFSFFQTNTLGAESLFSHAAEMIGKIDGKIVDLYCGTGSIGISFLKLGIGNSLVGVEIVPEAIQDAYNNAKINGVEDKVYFTAQASEKALHQGGEIVPHLQDTKLIIVDPPREGLHPNVVDFLGNLKTTESFKLLYISCNPITMARDTQLLQEKGFNIKKIQAVDMFPQTHHIETIGLFN